MLRFLALSFASQTIGAGQAVLPAACQIWLGSLDLGVDMVWHPAVGEHHPPASSYFILQTPAN